LIALPITIIGLSLSKVQPVPTSGPFLVLGDSLLFYLIGRIMHPGLPAGMDIYLNSVALAGWLGFLITGLNLLPIGQLDGGHAAYAVLFDRRKILYVPLALIMLGCGLLLWPGWIFWAVLAFFMSRRDPLIKDALTPLTLREKLLALIPLVILILTFIPKPLSIGYR
jgi:membrane-associated protease RseP (regulator of RpoE activity)